MLLFFTLLIGCEQAVIADQESRLNKTLKQDAKPNEPLPASKVEPLNKLKPEDIAEKALISAGQVSTLTFKTTDWLELIPEDDLETLLNPPEYIISIEDGSSADQIYTNFDNDMSSGTGEDDRYQQALISTQVIKAMDGKNIRIPGFVVPAEFNDQQQITSFFLVPYFGACLHSPPPPPNQIIFVYSETAFDHESLYQPVWISGTLSTDLFEDPIATSAYMMEMAIIEDYTEEDELEAD